MRIGMQDLCNQLYGRWKIRGAADSGGYGHHWAQEKAGCDNAWIRHRLPPHRIQQPMGTLNRPYSFVSIFGQAVDCSWFIRFIRLSPGSCVCVCPILIHFNHLPRIARFRGVANFVNVDVCQHLRGCHLTESRGC